MSEDLQYRLRNLEVVPPPDNWNRIVGRLEEDHSVAVGFELRLAEAEIEPPPAAWNTIAAFLDQQKKPKARMVPMRYTRIAAAAVVIGLIGFSAFYYFNRDYNNQLVSTSSLPVASTLSDPKTTQKPTASSEKEKNSGEPKKLPASVQKRVSNNVVKQTKGEYNPVEQSSMAYYYESPKPVSYADLEKAVDMAAEEIAVAAPLIRDRDGNIIMDLALVSASDQKYITVTGPNGQQTRLSKKFLSLMEYLNGEVRQEDLDYEGLVWKERFQNWRSKLVEQVAFTPAASNFLDIFELKELLHER